MQTISPWITVTQQRRIMATPMSIHVAVPPGEAGVANAAIARALAWLESLSDRLTRFSEDSELAQLNAAAGTWRAVSGTLYTVVAESVAAARATDGLFDPALLPLLEALGYNRDYDEIKPRATDAAGAPDMTDMTDMTETTGAANETPFVAGRWREIELDAQRLRIRLPTGARLDLGGIAKGWAADAVLARHLARFDNVLVNAGGDMRAQGGVAPEKPWPIGIGNPLAAQDDADDADGADDAASGPVLTLGHGGIATSGANVRWWYQTGKRQHHLLDPRTGRPIPLWIDARDDTDGLEAPLIATATALAPTAAHAEVAAKVALLRGYPEALQRVESAWAARHEAQATPYGDSAVALLVILGDGRIVGSANIHEFLRDVGGGGELWLE